MTDEERKAFIDERSNYYCSNNMKLLKAVCDPLIAMKGDDYCRDDLYEIALWTLLESLNTYEPDKNCSFNTYLVGNIKRSYYDWTRDRERQCRCNVQRDKNGQVLRNENGRPLIIPDVSLDAPSETNMDIREQIPSDFDIDREAGFEIGISCGEKYHEFINTLSDTQKKIAKLIAYGYNSTEIKEDLGISDKKYARCLEDMKSFETLRILKKGIKCNNNEVEDIKMDTTNSEINVESVQTLEKSKKEALLVSSIIRKIDDCTIRFNHPLQRSHGQWDAKMKGNLISDILQGNPIPQIVLAEQVVNGLSIIWDIDGKQRCTNVHSFKYDGFPISKKVRRPVVTYQAILKNKDGIPILDENGFPTSERRTFDIRNKRFSELPKELQDKFLDYNFDIIQYLNCTSTDIAYHIERYNDGKPMNASQKGFTRIGEEFAMQTKSISAMPFFKELGAYTGAQLKNGAVDRVVVESIMAMHYIDNWKSNLDDMCDFLKNNAKHEQFDELEDIIDRITNVGTEDIFEMFNVKDSFVWFASFKKFMNMGMNDNRFIDFMLEFKETLHNKEINGRSYDTLTYDKETGKKKGTKDKSVIVAKIKLIEQLMFEYFGLPGDTISNKTSENIIDMDSNIVSNNNSSNEVYVPESLKEYVEMFINFDTIHECSSTEEEKVQCALDTLCLINKVISKTKDAGDVHFYMELLDDLTANIPVGTSGIINIQNIPSVISIISYACEVDYYNEFVVWFTGSLIKEDTFKSDQEENYLHMNKSFSAYVNIDMDTSKREIA